ncbi:MAG: arsenite methyltransferase [Deltaproteobacteria bacterium]|nr:MAG: arsenite methyltransferase [Deltaproteobacteria bacterium]
MAKKHPDDIRIFVRDKYAEVANRDSKGCGCTPFPSCCGEPTVSLDDLGALGGYSLEELSIAPEGANMGLGCGNPQAIASLQPGETVVDLGSGGGFDCFLAARKVGETGRVIGVDMTPEMVAKARENARKGDYANVEFRLGEIEHLPVEDGSADVIISNCVINLSPEKLDVFRDAYRILKPGGRLAITDVVATAPLPPEMKNDLDLLSSCVSGAATVNEIEEMLLEAGFGDIAVEILEGSRELIREWVPGKNVEEYIVSATIEARKPSKE